MYKALHFLCQQNVNKFCNNVYPFRQKIEVGFMRDIKRKAFSLWNAAHNFCDIFMPNSV